MMSPIKTAIPVHILAFGAGCLGIALFSLMDAAMKELALAMGALAATFLRNCLNTVFAGALFVSQKKGAPSRLALFHHGRRAIVIALMSVLFFHGITLLPLAESIALSFIAPVIALVLAAVMLGETIGKGAIWASVFGLIGVGVILAGRLSGAYHAGAAEGAAAVLISACLYAYNLILARQQAMVADAVEITFFQPFIVILLLLPFILIFPPKAAPDLTQWGLLVGAAMLAMVSLLLLSWAYARAEAQILIPVEYTGFLWAALFGWLFFAEPLTVATLIGTALIVAGSIMAARRQPALVEEHEAFPG
jgi:S-adenosylmethionine uptake transporter